MLDQLSNPVVTDALVVSLKTTLIAQALILLFGTPTAYLLATRRFPGRVALRHARRAAARAAAGGRRASGCSPRSAASGCSARRSTLRDHDPVHAERRSSLAVAFVASPLYVRQAIAAFEAVDPNLVAASRTLGAGPARTFFRVALPLARGGLAAGEALAFARGLGEFGATIMFAGSLQGVTQTLPLAIYAEFDVDFDVDARDQRAARPDQRRPPRLPQADLAMAALSGGPHRSLFARLSSS